MENIIVFIPLTTLIVGALITKKVAGPMILAAFLGAVFVHKGNFFTGFINMLYDTLSNSSFQFVILILVGFGAMIQLFQESGAFMGFGKTVVRYARGKRAALLFSWLMAFVMFVDDYLGTLTISFSMKNVTDRVGVPREHLAFQSNAMAAAVCVVIPFSSWTAFTVGLISDEGLGYLDYIHGLPFMFYPMIIIVISLLLSLGLLPKVGAMKQAYERVEKGGPAFVPEDNLGSIVDIKEPDPDKESSAWNAVIPIVVMVAVVLMFDNDLVHGLMAGIVVQGILYVSQKIMTVGEVVHHFYEGAKSMAGMCVLVGFAFTLTAANEEMGFFEILIGGIGGAVPTWLLPALVFVVIALTTFATAGYWVIQIIAIPVFIPLSLAVGVNPIYVVAAIMSGVTFGCNLCFYADPIFMTAAGTGLSNLQIIKTTAPYSLAAAALTLAGYVAVGILFC